MRAILCIFGIHDYNVFTMQPSEARPGKYDVVAQCRRCNETHWLTVSARRARRMGLELPEN